MTRPTEVVDGGKYVVIHLRISSACVGERYIRQHSEMKRVGNVVSTVGGSGVDC